MATITHQKTVTIPDWVQADLDAQIALGNYPIGTVLADIELPSDWNANHTLVLGADENFVTDAQLTVIQNTSGTNTGDQVGDGVTITGSGTIGDPFVAVSGSGDVVGPASSTDNAFARFDGTTGKLLQNSTATLDDSGNINTSGYIIANSLSVENYGWSQKDGANTFYFTIGLSENLTANRNLNVIINNVDRTINLSGNLTVSSAATISGTNTGDQDLSGLVPYTGATGNVNLGANQLTVHNIRPDASDGLLLESANGTDIGILGAGNTANATWYGSHNFDLATADTIASFGASKTLSSLSTATYPSLTELSYVKGVTSAIQTQLNTKLSSIACAITCVFDGMGSTITANSKVYLEVPFAMTITGWTIIADQTGSCVIDVWKDTYANYPPVVGDSIAGSEKPTLSSAAKNQDLSLTTWTTLSISAGDTLIFNVDSATTVQKVTVVIRGTRSA